MAESLVQVTEGVGKKLHTFQRTIGANNVEDEVVVQGENYLSSYVISTVSGPSSTATSAAHLLQIMAGASLKVRVRRIEMYQAALATAAALMQVAIYRLSTAGTGGTAFVPSPLDTTDPAAGATAMTLPTVKGTEGVILAAGQPYMLQTVGASAQLSQPSAVWDFDRPRSKPLIVAAGLANGIAIKNTSAGVANATVFFNVWLDESSF